MTRFVYKDDRFIDELRYILVRLDTLRRYERKSFALGELVYLEKASQQLNDALRCAEKRPKIVEEVGDPI